MTNSLYAFYVEHKDKVVYVTAKTWKEARNIVYRTVFKDVYSLVQIKGKKMLHNCSQTEGLVSIDEVCDKYAWWQCSCGNNSFLSIDSGDMCRCKKCGKEDKLIFFLG